MFPPVRGMMVWGAGRLLWRVGRVGGRGFFYFGCIWLRLVAFFRVLALGVGVGVLLFGGEIRGICCIWMLFCGILRHFAPVWGAFSR